MATLEVSVQKRDQFGKNAMHRLRAAGTIPAVLYGHQEEPTSLGIAEIALKKVVQQGGNVILTLKIDGLKEPKTALIKEMQRHPISGKIVHVDFYQISMKDKITVRVPVQVVGQAQCVGIRDGGILEHHLREVEVRCLPSAIPDSFPADIAAMKVGVSLHVSDLPIPEGVELITAGRETVLSISAPTELKETVATPEAAAAVPAQPEVIGEKEREERRAATDKVKEEKQKEKEASKA
jgi:large subunit ribosomal protein L25